jgi:hypothetical protein
VEVPLTWSQLRSWGHILRHLKEKTWPSGSEDTGYLCDNCCTVRQKLQKIFPDATIVLDEYHEAMEWYCIGHEEQKRLQSSKDLRRAINVVSITRPDCRVLTEARRTEQHIAPIRGGKVQKSTQLSTFSTCRFKSTLPTMPMSKQAMTLTWQSRECKLTFRSTVRKARRAAKTCLSHASTKCCS